MKPFYLESTVFYLKLSGNSLVAAGKKSHLHYDGGRIMPDLPGEFSDIKSLICPDISKSGIPGLY